MLRNHVGRSEGSEVFGDLRVAVDTVAQIERQLNGSGRKLVALQLHLTAGDVELAITTMFVISRATPVLPFLLEVDVWVK